MSPVKNGISLSKIVERFGGKVVGNDHTLIFGVGSLESSGTGDLSFLSDPRYMHKLLSTRASAIVIPPNTLQNGDQSYILCENPYLYFVRVMNEFFVDEGFKPEISNQATVSSRASLGADVFVGARAVIEDEVSVGKGASIGAGAYVGKGAVVGEYCDIKPNVTIYPRTQIGKRTVIHSGAVLGGDGFGYVYDAGSWVKVPQIGFLIIGDDVEIGSNTTIDCGALDNTFIGSGVKIDNQVQIGHNCFIGDNTAIAGCVGIAGSVKVGSRCKIGGAAMITGHLEITNDVTISAGSLVSRTLKHAGRYTGVYPLSDHEEWVRNAIQLRRLGRLKNNGR